MKIEEAKLILRACRPNGADDSDPLCAEALELVRQNAELRTWWELETALDRAIAAKFGQVAVPEGLHTSILAGANAEQSRRPTRWLPRLALAAMLALFLGVAATWFNQSRQPSFASYQKKMVELVSSGAEALDLETQDLGEIRKHLAAKANLVDFVVPASMEKLPTYGCQKLTWNGHCVSLVCFKQSEFGAVHCFIINTADLPKSSAPASPAPDVDQVGRWATATWERGGKTYLLAAYGEASRLKKLL